MRPTTLRKPIITVALCLVAGLLHAPRAGAQEEYRDREHTVPFAIAGENSVAVHLFSVLVPGTLRAEVSWEKGAAYAPALEASLKGPSAGPAAAYARQTSQSPLVLTHQVTREEIARGVAWRLVIRDPQGAGGAAGTVRLTVPFDAETDRAFQREKVSLSSGELWPSARLQAEFMRRLAAVDGRGLHGIISLTRTPTAEEASRLEALGLVRQSFLPGGHAFGFVRKGIDLRAPLVADLLRQLTPLEPEDKVDPEILEGNYRPYLVTPMDEEPRNYVLNSDGTLELSVLFAPDAAPGRVRQILQQAAGGVGVAQPSRQRAPYSALSDELWRVTLAPGRLLALAAFDEVQWIEAGPEPRLYENDDTRPAVNVDPVQDPQVDGGGNLVLVGGFPVYDGLTGAGVTVGVDDSGIDAGHPDLDVVADVAAAAAHGTHVAGIVAASGFQSDQLDGDGDPNGGTPFQWRGMAPEAGLIDSGDLITAASLLTAIQTNSLDAGNHSHALGTDGDYSAQNRSVDQAIRGGASSGGTPVPRRLKSFSAGNAGASAQYGNQRGYFATTKQMKNAIYVGNWDAGGNDLATGSSMGPTYDGRIQPTVVAPGTSIRSTGIDSTANGYRVSGGTSMASPVVAGVLALMLEGWEQTFSLPQGTTLDAAPPLPSTLRAVIVHTATDVVSNNVRNATSAEVDSDSNPGNGNDGLGVPTATAGPDFATGWGLLDARAAVDLLLEQKTQAGVPVPSRVIEDAVGQGDVDEFTFEVEDLGSLKVTLAWDDVEAAVQSPITSARLVNDLDLELVDPTGAVFYPWQLGQTILDLGGTPLPDGAQPPGTPIQVVIPITPTPTPALNDDYVPANALGGTGVWVATRGKDHLNNVEQVLVPALVAQQLGEWKLRVLGFNVVTASQDYSVVGFPVAKPNPKIQVPGSVDAGAACVGGSSSATLDVCNTGKKYLYVGPITSSDPQFAVTVPSAGYPVAISPDFCFPFEVVFSPAGPGSRTGTLTVPSNDPVNPTTDVDVSGLGTEPDVRITGSTDFGVGSAWQPTEKTVSVCNTGGCNLNVVSSAVDCADFTLVNDPFPATVSPDSCLDLVIRFTPLLPGRKSCELTVTSDDPDSPAVKRTLTARTPPAMSLHAGLVDPHGALSNVARQGSTLNLDFVYWFRPRWAWDVRLGASSFDGKAGLPDTDLWSLAANARFTINPAAPVRVFLNGGLGVYHVDPGDFEGGGNLGLGLNVPAGPRFAFEATYNHHWAFTASPTLEFGQAQLGFLVFF